MREVSYFITRIDIPSPDNMHYLESSARLRNMSKQKLVRALINVILNDQMILSVLDDDRDVVPREQMIPPERTRRLPDKIFDAVTPRPTRFNPSIRPRRAASPEYTKNELRDQIAQAMANTARLDAAE